MMVIETSNAWKHFAARALEWLNAFVLFGFGCYLIMHPGMFQDPRISALWAGMSAVASQETWGLVTLLVGFMRLSALYINGHHKRTPMIRLATSFVSAFIWTQVVLGLWNSDVPNTGLVVYTSLILADIYSAFRAGADATFVARRHQLQEPGSNVTSIGKRS